MEVPSRRSARAMMMSAAFTLRGMSTVFTHILYATASSPFGWLRTAVRNSDGLHGGLPGHALNWLIMTS